MGNSEYITKIYNLNEKTGFRNFKDSDGINDAFFSLNIIIV